MIDIFVLYEDLKKHIGDDYDDAFYDAAEGAAQFDIVKEMCEKIMDELQSNEVLK